MAIKLGAAGLPTGGTPTPKLRVSTVGGVSSALANIDYAIKELYLDEEVQRLVVDDNPLLGMIPRADVFEGDLLPLPVIYGNSHGRSRNLATAATNAGNHSGVRFQLSRVPDYAVAVIDNESAKAARRKGPGAFLDTVAEEMDRVLGGFGMGLGNACYRSGWGILADATCTGTAGTGLFTLSNAQEIVHFEVGMHLDVITNAAGNDSYTSVDAAVKAASTTFGVVTAVDRDAGTVTVSVTTDIDTTYTVVLTSSHVIGLALEGDAAVDANDDLRMTKMAGLQSWIPATAPTSGDSFFFVDRSVDTQRLAGGRYDGTGDSIEEAYINMMTRAARNGNGKITHIFTSYEDYGRLVNALGAKKEYDQSVTVKSVVPGADIGFRGIRIIGPKGDAIVMPDQNCQTGVAWGLDFSDPRIWKLYTLDSVPHMVDEAAGKGGGFQLAAASTSQSNGDAVQYRWAAYFNMGCRAPGRNIRGALPTT